MFNDPCFILMRAMGEIQAKTLPKIQPVFSKESLGPAMATILAHGQI
jgi:hypothetical protein